MAVKTIHVSDLSGREAEEQELARLVVVEHPDYKELPATLEVLPDEVAGLQSVEQLVQLEYYAPGERRPQRLTITRDQFNDLAKDEDMGAVLLRAITAAHEQRGRATSPARGRGGTAGRPKVNYASLEHAGEPHRGRITDAEKQLVREHLEEINQRLREQGLREIDSKDPTMRERYGLG